MPEAAGARALGKGLAGWVAQAVHACSRPLRCSWSKVGSDAASAALFGTLLPFAFAAASEVSLLEPARVGRATTSKGKGWLITKLACA